MGMEVAASKADQDSAAIPTKAERTRVRILDAAARVLRNRGYGNMRLSDVAEIAAVQTAALYYHFPSREALIEEVVTLGQQRVYDHVMDELEGVGQELDALGRIRVAVRAHLEVTLRDCDHASASIRTLGQLPANIRRRQLEEQRKYGDVWRTLIQDAIEAGQVDPSFRSSAMRMLALGALNWVPEWWNPQQGSLAEIIEAAQAFVLDGLRARPFGAP